MTLHTHKQCSNSAVAAVDPATLLSMEFNLVNSSMWLSATIQQLRSPPLMSLQQDWNGVIYHTLEISQFCLGTLWRFSRNAQHPSGALHVVNIIISSIVISLVFVSSNFIYYAIWTLFTLKTLHSITDQSRMVYPQSWLGVSCCNFFLSPYGVTILRQSSDITLSDDLDFS